MTGRSQRWTQAAAASLGMCLALACPGCSSRTAAHTRQGEALSAVVPLNTYVSARLAGTDRGIAKFFYPQLQVFDGSGKLVFSGHDAVRNAALMRGLPESVRGLRPLPGDASLAQVIDLVPAFRKRKGELLARHAVTVVSILLEGCDACTVQESALDGAERRLLGRGVNLLVTRLSHP